MVRQARFYSPVVLHHVSWQYTEKFGVSRQAVYAAFSLMEQVGRLDSEAM